MYTGNTCVVVGYVYAYTYTHPYIYNMAQVRAWHMGVHIYYSVDGVSYPQHICVLVCVLCVYTHDRQHTHTHTQMTYCIGDMHGTTLMKALL
jgi:2-iminoacetate synthase ThiH